MELTGFVLWGLSGAPDSGQKRRAILHHLGMPAYLSAGAMIDLINATMGREAFAALCGELFTA